MSPEEEEQEEESFFGMETTKLSPRIMMFYPDDHDHDTNDNDNDDDDDDAYGIFLSFSEDDNDEHHYNESAASPSLKYNDYAFHKTTTAPFGVTTAAAAAARL